MIPQRPCETPEDTSSEAASSTASNERRSRDMLLARLLATLTSLTFVALGLMSVMTQHYDGRSTKLGGAQVSLDGEPAVAMGWGMIFLGLLPLALWFSGKRPALAWLLFCISAAAVSFYLTYQGVKI